MHPPASTSPENGIRLFANGDSLSAHHLRDRVANEVHARPFEPIETPRRFFLLGYLTDGEQADEDREHIERFCASHNAPPPDAHARHHMVTAGKYRLRWEQHSEFTTYTWHTAVGAAPAFSHAALADVPIKGSPTAPGPAIVAIHLAIVKEGDAAPLDELFDPSSLCVSAVEDRTALAATDFKQDAHGFTRILIIDRGLGAARAGSVAQRLLEIETYRNLALLGLPEAQRIAPDVARIEGHLARLASEQKSSAGALEDNRRQLEQLIDLAAEVEAISADTSFRFGATQAYAEIIESRLAAIGQDREEAYFTWSGFLNRRMKPAIRTVQTMQGRLTTLSQKLTRAADLLRTRVNIALEQQNRDLLRSMNRRARMQLRLQQTVEGLSVAAVSYYVVGLIGYLAKGWEKTGMGVPAGAVTALSVPVVVLGVWMIVRRIRRSHEGKPNASGE